MLLCTQPLASVSPIWSHPPGASPNIRSSLPRGSTRRISPCGETWMLPAWRMTILPDAGRDVGAGCFGAALAFPERLERDAESQLRPGPLERDAVAGVLLECSAKGGDRRIEALGAALSSPSLASVLSRASCVMAHSSGTRSRVLSSS